MEPSLSTMIEKPARPSEDPELDPESDHALLLGIAAHVAAFEGWAKRLDGQFLEWSQRNAQEHESICQRLSGLEQRRAERMALPLVAIVLSVLSIVAVVWVTGARSTGAVSCSVAGTL